VLENGYNQNITREEAKTLASKAVAAAIERDPGSGNGVDVLDIASLMVKEVR
jgi:proteasome beta subunit